MHFRKVGKIFLNVVFKEPYKQPKTFFSRGIVRKLDPGRAEKLFCSIVKDGTKEMSFEDFKKLIPSKNV